MLELGEAEENRRVAGGTGQEEGRPEVPKVKGLSRRPPGLRELCRVQQLATRSRDLLCILNLKHP